MLSIFSVQALAIIGVCLAVLFLLFFKQRSAFFIRIAVRAVIGSVLIMGIDAICSYFSLTPFVGLNPFTICICALLGLPGVLFMFLMPLI